MSSFLCFRGRENGRPPTDSTPRSTAGFGHTWVFFHGDCEGSLEPVVALQFDDAGCTLLVGLGSVRIGQNRTMRHSSGVLRILLQQIDQLLELSADFVLDGHRLFLLGSGEAQASLSYALGPTFDGRAWAYLVRFPLRSDPAMSQLSPWPDLALRPIIING